MAKKKVQIVITADNKAKKELGETEQAANTMQAAFTAAAVIGAAKLTYEFAELGAESLRTKQAFEAISGGADEAAERLDAMKRATRGALSEQDAMRAANQLMQMGLADSAAELANVSEMAVRLGSAMGVDAKTALSDFSLLLANQSIPRLDTFGISAGKVREQMADLARQFPEMTKEQRFMTATMEQGTAAMNRLGDAQEDEMLKMEQASAAVEDLKVALAELVAGPVTDFVGTLGDGITVLKDLVTWTDRVNDAVNQQRKTLVETTSSYEDYVDGVIDAELAAGRMTERQADYNRYALKHIETNAEYSESLDVLTRAAYELRDVYIPLASETDSVRDKMAMVRDVVPEATEAIIEGGDAAGTATPLYGGLADNVTDLGRAFMDGIPTQEDFFRLLLETERAAGTSTTQLAAMARELGVASDAEISAQLAMYEMVDAYNAGERSIQDVGSAAREMEKYSAGMAKAAELEAKATDEANEGNAAAALLLRDQAEAEREAAEEAFELAMAITDAETAMVDADEVAGELTETIHDTESAFGDTVLSVQALNEEIALIEREIKIKMQATIYWGSGTGGAGTSGGEPEFQTGTDFVPYTGRFRLHKGEAVLNPQEAAVYREVKQQDSRSFTLNYYDQSGNVADVVGLFRLEQAFLGG